MIYDTDSACSVRLRYDLLREFGMLYLVSLCSAGEFRHCPWNALVGNVGEEMSDDVEPASSLVIGSCNESRFPRSIRRLKHFVTHPRVFVPARKRFEVHLRKLPDLATIVDPRPQTPLLFFGAHLEPIT